ncbi:phosphopentomutase [Clostridium sediminicola]|uniref:phosphopentomutase n=1 Tax=Clostridium sediminicola TaxID=3114879 RepID=UPI0031F215B4
MGRFMVLVLDSFGIGYMDDVKEVRPQDIGANTCKHILEKHPEVKLRNLEKLGLMNALGDNLGVMKKNEMAVFGISKLQHFGCDTFYGHQEIMGTLPQKPLTEAFSKSIDRVADTLKESGYEVEYKGNGPYYLLVNNSVAIGDNIEADLGQAYNITASLDIVDFDEVTEIGKIVRKEVKVPRVIAFGGKNVNIEDILNAEEVKGDYIGINAPKSGVYNEGYKVIHLGYGVNPDVQIPTILGKNDIAVTLIGKVADIVHNQYGKSIFSVDTREVMENMIKEMDNLHRGFMCVNVQETDLAGHRQNVEKYLEKLIITDVYMGRVIEKMNKEDILVVMADHGNDPTIGHSRHTRENVPLLIYKKDIENKFIGHRKTLADVGATVAEYFNVEYPENGQSFLHLINDK